MPKTVRRRKGYFAFPWLLLCIFILLILSSFLNLNAFGYTENIYLSIIVLQLLIFAIPSIFYVKLRGDNYLSTLRLRPFSPSDALLTLLFILLIVFGSVAIKLIMYGFTGYTSDNYSLYTELIPAGNIDIVATLYVVLAVSLLPAVSEEFIFRSVGLSDYLNSGVSPLASCVITSLLFSLIHFSPAQLPVYFFCGMVLSILTLLTDSVFTAIIAHFANNFISLFFESYLQRLIRSGNTAALVFISIGVTLISLTLIFFFISWRLKKYGDDRVRIPLLFRYTAEEKKGSFKKLKNALLTPGFIFCIIIFIVYTILKLTRVIN